MYNYFHLVNERENIFTYLLTYLLATNTIDQSTTITHQKLKTFPTNTGNN